jgi:hypothetical protein
VVEYGVCSHCLEVKACHGWRRPKPIKLSLFATFDPDVLPETVETLICSECLSRGSVLEIPDVLDAEFIDA